MKMYLALISAAALALSACSQEPAKPAEPTPPATASAPVETATSAPAPASAPSAATASAPTATAECEATIEANDQMKYNVAELDVKRSCVTFTVHLKHVGTMPKAAMGHNIVIAKTADAQAIATEGASAGAEHDYLKTDDPRIIAHSKLIGGGEETTMTFETAKLGNDQNEFFCSFPGHYALMKGNVKLVD